MKVGDLVRETRKKHTTAPVMGVVVGFDSAGDPIIRNNKTGVVCAHWAHKTVVVNESR